VQHLDALGGDDEPVSRVDGEVAERVGRGRAGRDERQPDGRGQELLASLP